MTTTSRSIAALLTTLVALAGTARADPVRDAKKTVAIVAFDVEGTLAEVKDTILLGVEKGIASAGFSVLPPSTTLPTDGASPACDNPACFRQLGNRTGAATLAFGNVTSSNDYFSVTVTLVRADDGRELARHNLTCASLDPCAPVPDSARSAAREAARAAWGVLTTLASEAAAAAAVPTPTAPALVGEPHTSVAAHPRWPYVVSGGVAAAAVATGIFLMAIHHDGADCRPVCLNRHNTLLPGLAATTGGGLLAIGTAVGYLLWGAPAAVVVGPGSLSLAFTDRF